jgi:hypothetical protein
MSQLVIEGDDVQVLTELLNYMAETERDMFENNLEDDCVQPLYGVDPDFWEEEVEQYFDMVHNCDCQELVETQLIRVAEISQGNPFCNVIRLQGALGL